MTNDTRTADDIERDIEAERTRMSGTINELQRKFSVEGIVSDIGAMFRDQGGDIGRSISATVGRNPAAVALVGLGVAWLVLGSGRGADKAARRQDRDMVYGGYWNRSTPGSQGPGATMKEADDAWFDDGGMVYAKAQHAPAHAKSPMDADAGQGVAGVLRTGAEAVAGAVSGAVGAVRDTAMVLTERLSLGTEGMTDEARARVVAARQTAHDARIAAQNALTKGGRTVSNLFEDQPLVVGALAIALGAAVGGLLPHSQVEDETLGANSDRLFAEAQKVFRDERDKALAGVKAAAKEAQGVLKDTGAELAAHLPDGKSAGTLIVDHVADAAARVSGATRDETERQGLTGERRS